MYFLTDHTNKISFGWSAKSGCSHVKNLFEYLTTGNERPHGDDLHKLEDYGSPPTPDYKFIIVVRNPYERVISGFTEKYRTVGDFYPLWPKDVPLTFYNFIDRLQSQDFSVVDFHHFAPQFSEAWEDSILENPYVRFYDLKSIDYNYLEKIYKKSIPEYIKNFRGRHSNTNPYKDLGKIHHLELNSYNSVRPLTSNFFTKNLKTKIKTIYSKDFVILKSVGFDYILDI